MLVLAFEETALGLALESAVVHSVLWLGGGE
jgi:hypothetical protein